MSDSFTVIRSTWLSRKPSSWATVATALATLVLFIGCAMYWSDFAGLAHLMPASKALAIDQGETFRLWTALFAHADLGHLMSNTLLFFVLGYFLFGYFGFWIFPGAALLGGAITNYLTLLSYSPQTQLVGASGMVFWMGGAWLTLYLLTYRQRTVMARLLRVLGVTLALFMPVEAFDPNVSYRAHFIGFGLGIVWATGYFLLKRSQFRKAEVHEVVIEEPEISDATWSDSTPTSVEPRLRVY